jgi:hypothetical protein
LIIFCLFIFLASTNSETAFVSNRLGEKTQEIQQLLDSERALKTSLDKAQDEIELQAFTASSILDESINVTFSSFFYRSQKAVFQCCYLIIWNR